MKKLAIMLIFLSAVFSCSNEESLVYRIERVQPAKDRPVFSKDRVEGEDCVGLVFPFLFGKLTLDLQRAYNNAMEKAPPETQSLAFGEVYTRAFFLPPLVLFRCVVVTGSPSMD